MEQVESQLVSDHTCYSFPKGYDVNTSIDANKVLEESKQNKMKTVKETEREQNSNQSEPESFVKDSPNVKDDSHLDSISEMQLVTYSNDSDNNQDIVGNVEPIQDDPSIIPESATSSKNQVLSTNLFFESDQVKIQDRAKAFLFSNLEQKPNKIPSDDLVDKKQTLNNTGQPEKTNPQPQNTYSQVDQMKGAQQTSENLKENTNSNSEDTLTELGKSVKFSNSKKSFESEDDKQEHIKSPEKDIKVAFEVVNNMTNEMFQEPSNLKKSNEKAPSNYQNPVALSSDPLSEARPYHKKIHYNKIENTVNTCNGIQPYEVNEIASKDHSETEKSNNSKQEDYLNSKKEKKHKKKNKKNKKDKKDKDNEEEKTTENESQKTIDPQLTSEKVPCPPTNQNAVPNPIFNQCQPPSIPINQVQPNTSTPVTSSMPHQVNPTHPPLNGPSAAEIEVAKFNQRISIVTQNTTITPEQKKNAFDAITQDYTINMQAITQGFNFQQQTSAGIHQNPSGGGSNPAHAQSLRQPPQMNMQEADPSSSSVGQPNHHNSTKKHKKDKKKKDRHTHKEKVENAVSPDSERVRKGDSITEEESYPNVTDFNPPAVSESSFNSIPKKIKKSKHKKSKKSKKVEVEDNAEENKEDKKKHSLKSETPIIVYECGDKVIAYHNKDIFMKYFKIRYSSTVLKQLKNDKKLKAEELISLVEEDKFLDFKRKYDIKNHF